MKEVNEFYFMMANMRNGIFIWVSKAKGKLEFLYGKEPDEIDEMDEENHEFLDFYVKKRKSKMNYLDLPSRAV